MGALARLSSTDSMFLTPLPSRGTVHAFVPFIRAASTGHLPCAREFTDDEWHTRTNHLVHIPEPIDDIVLRLAEGTRFALAIIAQREGFLDE